MVSTGFCTRANDCAFPHRQPVGVPDPTAADSTDATEEPPDTACSICFESPDFYGLLGASRMDWGGLRVPARAHNLPTSLLFLEECSHVFCLACIRSWRDSRKREAQANSKTCSSTIKLPLVQPAQPRADGARRGFSFQAHSVGASQTSSFLRPGSRLTERTSARSSGTTKTRSS